MHCSSNHYVCYPLEQNLYRVYERRKEMSDLASPYKKLKSYRYLQFLNTFFDTINTVVVGGGGKYMTHSTS